jgi:AcrR family transcriptional regulator
MYITMDTKKRSYEMRARKDATDATYNAIAQAALDSVAAKRSLSVTLGSVAERAGVTVKTVLRHFGSRDALIDAAWSRALQDLVLERSAPPGDPEGALSVLIEHYELRGDMVLGLLAEEVEDPRALEICDSGRLEHRGWVADVFGPELPAEAVERSRLIDALVVATDVYAWKLLRRDRGLSVDEVRDRMLLMTSALLAVPAKSLDPQ